MLDERSLNTHHRGVLGLQCHKLFEVSKFGNRPTESAESEPLSVRVWLVRVGLGDE